MTARGTRGGFTLIEMVAVILIIGLLVGVVSSGLNSARENAWRTRARDTARQLVDAWNLYLLDNREFPARQDLLAGKVAGESKGDVGIPATMKALKPLRYARDPDTGKWKERKTKYIELSFEEAYERAKDADEGEMGGVGAQTKDKALKGDNAVALTDRWKQPIYFELDFDYDGICEAPGFMPSFDGRKDDKGGKDGKGKKKENTRSKVKGNAVAWSMGPPARKGRKWVGAWK